MGKKRISEAGGKILKMRDGKEYAVTGERGAYWLCEGTQFRKSNPNIAEVREDTRKAETAQESTDEPAED